MPYKFGDVVLVQFPFTSQKAFKKRPAVVVSSKTYNTARPDVVIMAITSQLRSAEIPGEVWINDWQAAGLLKPSAIMPVLPLSNRACFSRVWALSIRRISRRYAMPSQRYWDNEARQPSVTVKSPLQ